VAASGRRCTQRVFLEFHHREPYALGGETTAANISLRCRAHNAYEAELAFGPRVPASVMPLSPLPVVRETPAPDGARILGPAAPPEPGRRRVNSPRGESLPGTPPLPLSRSEPFRVSPAGLLLPP
jgi:hypothetical protein